MNKLSERHVQYLDKEYDWFASRCAVKGSSTVKRQNTLFLPMPSAMSAITSAPGSQSIGANTTGPVARSLQENSPNAYPSNPAYAAYKTRAEFPDYAANTLRGLLGIAIKSMPEVDLPPKMKYLIENATIDGESLEDLYKRALSEVFQTGRYTLCVDINTTTKLPIIVPYVAETFTNWHESVRGGRKQLIWAIFEESIETNPEDFTLTSDDNKKQQRVLSLNEKGEFSVRTYIDNLLQDDATVPTLMGKAFDRLPVVVIGSTNFDPDVDLVPLSGIAEVSFAIYRKTADMSQAEFMTCNPMFVVSGVDANAGPKIVGSTVAYVIENADGKAYYTQTDSSGLNFVLTDIERLKSQAIIYGVSLLGGSKGGVESGEALRLRQEASGATLKSVVEQVGRGIERTLKVMAEWLGLNPDTISFSPSTDFSDLSLSSDEMNALLQAWLNGGISYDTYHQNLKDAGYVVEGRSSEEEQELMSTEPPKLMSATNAPASPVQQELPL